MNTYSVVGGGGLNIHTREWGNPKGSPILLIHGWSQSHLCWEKQVESSLADEFRLVAIDNRGHGMSDQPLELEHYNNPQLWADDINAVIKTLELDKPVLAGWSYGGFIMSDYVRAYGQDDIAGINYVGAAVKLDATVFGPLIGPGFYENGPVATDADLPTSITGIINFLHACFANPIPADEFARILAFNMAVPAQIRGNLATREVNSDDVLTGMTIPVLVTQGEKDTVVLSAMAEYILDKCPTAKGSMYPNVGHVPFYENAERFNEELAAFTRMANG